MHKNPVIKFFIFLIGYIIYPFSFLFPRSKKKWAFGSFRESFNDNSKYLYIYASEHCPTDIEVVWVSAGRKTVNHIQSLGLKAYHIGSFKGLWYALRSKYWFFNSYTSDIFFFASGGAECVNLWHGLPLKKIEFGITSGPLADRYVERKFKECFYHPEAFRRPDHVLCPSDFLADIYSYSFRIGSSQLLKAGYPRNEILTMEENSRLSFIRKYEPDVTIDIIEQLTQYNKVYIYMPTWRDSQKDVFSQNINLPALNKVLKEQNGLLILKPHANTQVKKELLSQYENIMLFDNQMDVYGILPYTDVLITDYSSVLYDYMLMKGKNVILYVYDYKEYLNGRDFNFSYFENVAGKLVYNFNELIDAIERSDYAMDENKRIQIVNHLWGKDNIDSACEKIINRVTA